MKKIDGRSKAARAVKALAARALQYEEPAASSLQYEDENGVLTSQTGKRYAPLELVPERAEMTILQEAHELIYGNRETEYGDPRENLEAVARHWSTYLEQARGVQLPTLDAEDVCWMMALLKMCRSHTSAGRDSLVDAAGYIGLIERVRA